MIWRLSHRADPLAREIADRHYNRQKPGAPQFVPPGRCLVLCCPGAFWVTSWPFGEYVKHAWPGAMVCSAFRWESGPVASSMIIDALSATRWRWPDGAYEGLVRPAGRGRFVWTGDVRPAPGRVLFAPLRWRRPRWIFVDSMSDLFHEGLPEPVVDRVFAVMRLARQHTFQLLTKRASLMADYLLPGSGAAARVRDDAELLERGGGGPDCPDRVGTRMFTTPRAWPLVNVLLGASELRCPVTAATLLDYAPLVPRPRERGRSYPERVRYPELDVPVAGDVPPLPATRGDCREGPRPCPMVSCKFHLYLDVNPHTGSIKLNFPHLEVDQVPETCALDVADRGGVTLEEVGRVLNLTRERSRQLEVKALDKLKWARRLI